MPVPVSDYFWLWLHVRFCGASDYACLRTSDYAGLRTSDEAYLCTSGYACLRTSDDAVAGFRLLLVMVGCEVSWRL